MIEVGRVHGQLFQTRKRIRFDFDLGRFKYLLQRWAVGNIGENKIHGSQGSTLKRKSCKAQWNILHKAVHFYLFEQQAKKKDKNDE